MTRNEYEIIDIGSKGKRNALVVGKKYRKKETAERRARTLSKQNPSTFLVVKVSKSMAFKNGKQIR